MATENAMMLTLADASSDVAVRISHLARRVRQSLHHRVLGGHPAPGCSRDGQPAGGPPSPPDSVRYRNNRSGARPAVCLRRDRRRLLAHPVDRRGGISSCRARRGGGSLGRLCAPGNPRKRDVVEHETKHGAPAGEPRDARALVLTKTAVGRSFISMWWAVSFGRYPTLARRCWRPDSADPPARDRHGEETGVPFGGAQKRWGGRGGREAALRFLPRTSLRKRRLQRIGPESR